MMIAYDARPLQPQTRHWGVGVVVDSLIPRLRHRFQLSGIAHRFLGAEREGINTWPRVRGLNNLFFEASTLLVKNFDVYWGTNDFIPAIVSQPSLLTVHDLLLLKYPSDQRLTRLLAWRFASSVRRARKVVADSKTTADDLLAVFPEIGKKLEVALLGFNVAAETGGVCRPQPSNPEFRVPQQPYALMLGAHRPRKNLELAVAAVGRARDLGLRLNLVVTGNIDPCFQALVAQSKEFVSCAGVLPKSALFATLRQASALLFPSFYEGFGLPMLEAMAAGCPVLALDTAINRETAGDAARFFPKDAAPWANALDELVRVPSVREDMRARGLLNLQRFSWDKTAQVYADLFAATVLN